MSTITDSRGGIVLIYLTVTRCCSFPPACVCEHNTDRRIQTMIGKIWARNSRGINRRRRRLSGALSGRSISCADRTDSVHLSGLVCTKPDTTAEQSSRLKSSVTAAIHQARRTIRWDSPGNADDTALPPALSSSSFGGPICASNHKLDQIGRIN